MDINHSLSILNNLQSKDTLSLSKLFQLHRTISSTTNNLKLQSANTRDSLDSDLLQLNNLQYQISSLLLEISTNDNLFPTSTITSNTLELTSDYSSNLNNLNQQLNSRKSCVQQIQNLTSLKNTLIAQNSLKQQQLSSIDDSLNSLMQASIPLQDKLSIDITKKRIIQLHASYLPIPLMHIYSQTTKFNIPFEIIGNLELAKLYTPEDSIIHSTSNDSHKRTFNNSTNMQYYSKHPLELLIKLSVNENVSLKLTFSYFDKLNLVGVVLGGEKNASLVDLSPSFVLSDLFPDDDATVWPNLESLPVSESLLDLKNLNGARPFIWAQELSHILKPKKQSEDEMSDVDSYESIALVTISDAVAKRWDNLKKLEQEIEQIKNSKLSSLGQAKVKAFKLVNDLLHSKRPGIRTFQLQVEITKGWSFIVAIQIFALYPSKYSSFNITSETWIKDKIERSGIRIPEHSAAIQATVNECRGMHQENDVLKWQVEMLLRCLHVYVKVVEGEPVEGIYAKESNGKY